MPTKPVTEIRSAGSQRDNRWLATVYDQHRSARFPRGRPWWGYLEYPNDRQTDPAFVTELTPGDHNDPLGSAWDAPWMPPQVTVAGGRSTYRLNVKRDQITWLYATMIADDVEALNRYYEAAAKIAYTKGWDAPNFGQQPSFQITSILRDPPHSPKIAEAAMAGDPWLLFYEGSPNPELELLLRGRPHILGARVVENVAPVTPAQVLAPEADIARLVADAVAAALEAERQANRGRMAKARAGKGQKAKSVPSAAVA